MRRGDQVYVERHGPGRVERVRGDMVLVWLDTGAAGWWPRHAVSAQSPLFA